MSQDTALSKTNTTPALNFAEPEHIPFIVSLLSSYPLGWQGIILNRVQLKPLQSPIVGYNNLNGLTIHLAGIAQLTARIEDKIVKATSVPGNICIHPAGNVSEYQWNAQATNLFLNFEPDLLNRLAEDVSLGDASRLTLREHFNFRDPLLYQLALALLTELTESGPLGQLYAETLGQATALQLIRQYSSHSAPRALPGKRLTYHQLRLLKDYLYDHLEQKISLNDLAEVVGLSPFHFTRLFKGATGLAPHQFLIRYRVERARELLEQGQLNLSQIAQQVGFVDQSHLNRHFKKVYGLNPNRLLTDSKNLPQKA